MDPAYVTEGKELFEEMRYTLALPVGSGGFRQPCYPRLAGSACVFALLNARGTSWAREALGAFKRLILQYSDEQADLLVSYLKSGILEFAKKGVVTTPAQEKAWLEQIRDSLVRIEADAMADPEVAKVRTLRKMGGVKAITAMKTVSAQTPETVTGSAGKSLMCLSRGGEWDKANQQCIMPAVPVDQSAVSVIETDPSYEQMQTTTDQGTVGVILTEPECVAAGKKWNPASMTCEDKSYTLYYILGGVGLLGIGGVAYYFSTKGKRATPNRRKRARRHVRRGSR